MNAAQVIAAQHMELGRILLSVSNPRISRLGVGAGAMNYALEEQLRSITRRICGIALSNPKCPVSSVDAAVGISVCGEYFIDFGEQEAIIQFLNELEYQHGWPTQTTVEALRMAWRLRSSPTHGSKQNLYD